MNAFRYDLNPLIARQRAVPIGTASSYTATNQQLEKQYEAIAESQRQDVGFLGLNAFMPVLEENFISSPFVSIGMEAQKLFLDQGKPKLSVDELQSRYGDFAYNFREPLTVRAAEAELERFTRRQFLQQYNSNFTGDANLNKALFIAPTLLGNAPTEIAIAAGLTLAGGAIGAAGAVASAASRTYRYAKYLKPLAQTGSILQKTGRVVGGKYSLGTGKLAQFATNTIHEGITINGVSSILTGISEYRQGADFNTALKIAGDEYGIGLVATPVLFGAGRLAGKGIEFTGNYIRQKSANRVSTIQSIAEDFKVEAETRPQAQRKTVVDEQGNTIDIEPVNTDNPQSIQSAIESRLDVEDVEKVEFLNEGLYTDTDIELKENVTLFDEASESIEEFIQDKQEPIETPDIIKDTEEIEVTTPEMKQEVDTAFLKSAMGVTSIKKLKDVARGLVDAVGLDDTDALVNTMITIAGNSKIKGDNKAAKSYAKLLEQLEKNPDVSMEEILRKSPPDLLSEYTAKPFLQPAEPRIQEQIPEQSSQAVQADVQQNHSFAYRQFEEMRNNTKLVERMEAIQRQVSELDPEKELPSYLNELAQQVAAQDPEVAALLLGRDPKQIMAFLAHIEDENVARTIDEYLNCRSIEG